MIFLDIAKYKFVLKTNEELILPSYKGSTLRGGFGTAFKRICCVNKKVSSCSACLLKEKCAYAYVFETSPPEESKCLKKLREVPRPFVIEPPQETKTIYRKGDGLEFFLILFGKAVEYLTYFVFTFKELGKIGIGKGRGKFELEAVYNLKDEIIYSNEDEILNRREFKTRLIGDCDLIFLYKTG